MPTTCRAQRLSIALGTCLAAACAHTQGEVKTTPPPQASAPAPSAASKAPELPEREELPLVLRETLSSSMERHGEELTYLLASVVLLRYEEAEELAQLLADEPKLGRPAAGDVDSLNAMLPESFFVHQDALAARAKTLASAARAKNDALLVKEFGALAETCVGCHSAYLHDDLKPAASGTEDAL